MGIADQRTSHYSWGSEHPRKSSPQALLSRAGIQDLFKRVQPLLTERSCSLTGNLPKELVRNQPHGVPGRLFTERCFTRGTSIQNYKQYTMQTTLQTGTARGHCCRTPCTATPECQGRRKPHRSLLWEKASTPAPGSKTISLWNITPGPSTP